MAKPSTFAGVTPPGLDDPALAETISSGNMPNPLLAVQEPKRVKAATRGKKLFKPWQFVVMLVVLAGMVGGTLALLL